MSADCLRSLLFIILGFLVTYLYLRNAYTSKAMFGCALATVVLIDLFSVNKRYVDNDSFIAPEESVEAFVPTQADLEILKDTSMNYRVLDLDGFDQARSSYFHKTVGGYHAAKLTRYNDLISEQIRKGNPEVINMLNARYFIKDGEAHLNPEAFGNAWLVDKVVYVDSPNQEMAALDSLPLRTVAVADNQFRTVLGSSQPVSAGDTIFETFYAPGRLDYEVQSRLGGVAVFSEVYFPWGWEAMIDDKPAEIGRVDYVLRALNIPPGRHHVSFVFKPRRLEATNTLGVISVSLIFLLCLLALIKVGVRFFRKD